MKRPTPRRLALWGTVPLVAGSVAFAAPAAADEYPDPDYVKIGTRVSGPNGSCADGKKASNDHVVVCFKEYGDKLYVKDAKKDGRSAYGEFDEHYTTFNGGDYKSCRNPYGVGTWAVCDYAIAENTRVKFFGYTRDNEGAGNIVRDATSFVFDWNSN